jgi:transposase
MTSSEAAMSLGVTERQVRRLKAKYTQEGEKGLQHGNRGRKPAHTISEEIRQEVARLYEDKYADSNFYHCAELLEEHEGLKISPSSVRRILMDAGRKAKNQRRRRPGHRARARRASEGALWQTDATPYEWLGTRYGKFALHAAIDDATSAVVGAVFTPNECMAGYFSTMKAGILRHGVPLALYSDQHTIFRSPKEKLTTDEELDGVQARLSNFGAAMAELGIEHIKATTPQAKGRIERLWCTLQDRLPVEFRLRGVADIDEANRALPELIEKHNRSFATPPAADQDMYRKLGEGVELDHILVLREKRQADRSSAVTYKKNLYVPASSISFEPRTAVEIRETMSGDVLAWYRGKIVELKRIERPSRTNRASASGKPVLWQCRNISAVRGGSKKATGHDLGAI